MSVNEQLRVSNTVLQGFVHRGEELDWLNFQGMPLTIEWLEKHGFKRDFKFFNLNGFELEYQDGKFWYRTINDFVEIIYAHTLENLYFIIKGKELMDETT